MRRSHPAAPGGPLPAEIRYVVVWMLENGSFDHILEALPGLGDVPDLSVWRDNSPLVSEAGFLQAPEKKLEGREEPTELQRSILELMDKLGEDTARMLRRS